jgi:DNA-binding transcriptional LysR family regulator
MNVTLRQLRVFVEVAHRRSFTTAARHLHLTQSALSHLMRELESQLGVRVIDRDTRNFALTAAGTELLQNAERILSEVDQTVSGLRDLVAKRRGRVTVAAPPVLAASLLPAAIARFKAEHPGVTVRLLDVLTGQILEAVRSGEADFGVGTFRKSEPEVELDTLYEDRLVAVLPCASPLAGRRRLAWKDLRDAPLVMMSSASAFHYLVDHAASEAGLTAAPAYEVGYMGTAIALVEAGLGIAVLPAYAGSMIDTRKAAVRPVDSPAVTREVSIVTRAGRSLSPAAQQFTDVLRETFSAAGAGLGREARRRASQR